MGKSGLPNQDSCNNGKKTSAYEVRLRSPILFEQTDLTEFKFDNAMDCLPQGIRIISTDHTVRYINPSFAKLCGASLEEVIGKKCWEIFPDPFCNTPECRLKRIMKGEKWVQVEIERTKADGTIIPCMLTAFPLYTADNRLIGIMESFRDVSEKKKLEANAREAEDRYRALVELSGEVGEGILMTQDRNRNEGVIIFASEQLAHMTRYDNGELVGKSVFDIISPDDRDSSLRRYRSRLRGESLPGLYQMNVLRKDGSLLPVELTGAMTWYKGKPANVLYLRDITERKVFEKSLLDERDKYKSFFENSPIATSERDYSEVKKIFDTLRKEGVSNFKQYFVQNPEQVYQCVKMARIIGYNKALIDAYGADKPEEIVGLVDLSIRSRAEFWQVFFNILTNLAEGKNYFHNEETIRTVNGLVKNIELITFVAPGHEQELSRVYSSFFDITELRKTQTNLQEYQKNLEDMVEARTRELESEIENRQKVEAKLKKLLDVETALNNQLEERMREKTRFVRILTHELKTPLTALIAASDLLNENPNTARSGTLAAQINKGALELSKRINELFDLTKGEIGSLPMNLEEIDVYQLLSEVVDYFAPQAEKKHIRLSYEWSEGLPFLNCDRERISQVLFNLLDNAFKNTPENGRIILTARLVDDNILVQIEDTGRGIPENDLKEIFKPYYKANIQGEGYIGTEGGLGLGLTLSRMFIELHGGKIWAESQEGNGCKFIFKLPVKSA